MAAPLRYPLILLAWGRWRRSICRCSPPPGTGGRCALPSPLAGAVRRPAAEPGAGRHPRLHAVVRRRRAADRPDHRRRPLAFGPLAAAGFPSAAAAGGAPSRRRRRRCCCSPKGLALAAAAVSDAAGRPVRHRAWPDDGPERAPLCCG